jgi:hypothetical protein
MKIVESFYSGFRRTIGMMKVVTVIYTITLLLGLILAFSFHSLISNLFDSRMELYKLLPDFDFMIYSDFMNNYTYLIQPFLQMIIWFGAFYFFFTVFFAGGVLKSFEGSIIKSKTQAFFAGCAKFFFRFLRLGIYTLIFQLIFFMIVSLIFAMILANVMESSAEPAIFAVLVIWIIFHLLFFIFISIISDYAKIILIKEDSNKVWKALYSSLKFSLRKIHLAFPLYILLLIIPAAATLIYFLVDTLVGKQSSLTVLIMFLIQQGFIWTRLFSKVWLIAGEYDFFSSQLIVRKQPLLTQEILTNETL